MSLPASRRPSRWCVRRRAACAVCACVARVLPTVGCPIGRHHAWHVPSVMGAPAVAAVRLHSRSRPCTAGYVPVHEVPCRVPLVGCAWCASSRAHQPLAHLLPAVRNPIQVNVPKTRRTYCKGKKCGKHQVHKVTQYKTGKASKFAQGARRYKHKQQGYGGQTKPVFHKKVRPGFCMRWHVVVAAR